MSIHTHKKLPKSVKMKKNKDKAEKSNKKLLRMWSMANEEIKIFFKFENQKRNDDDVRIT